MVQVFSKHDDAIWQATTKHSHYNYYYSFFNPLANKFLMSLKTILATKQSRCFTENKQFTLDIYWKCKVLLEC